ncbi:MAG: DHHA2 domain-containing protein, partial [Lachnospiraceae bacterium]
DEIIRWLTGYSQEELEEVKEKLMPYLHQVQVERKLDMIYVMLTNILEESTELIYVGDQAKEIAAAAFHGHHIDQGDSLWLKGVVSRKKQLIPAFLVALEEKYKMKKKTIREKRRPRKYKDPEEKRIIGK